MKTKDRKRAQLIQTMLDAATLLEGGEPVPNLSEAAFEESVAQTARNLRAYARGFCRHEVDGELSGDGRCLGCGAMRDSQNRKASRLLFS